VIVIRDGRVTESGPYATLLRNNGDFSRFISEYQQAPGETETDDVDPATRRATLKKQLDAMVMKKTASMTSMDSQPSKGYQASASSPSQPGQAINADGKSSEKSTETAKLIQKEGAAEGSVKLAVYKAYFRACGNWLSVTIGLAYVFTYAAQIGQNIWLADWSNTDANGTVNGTEPSVDLRMMLLLIACQVLMQLCSEVHWSLYGSWSVK